MPYSADLLQCNKDRQTADLIAIFFLKNEEAKIYVLAESSKNRNLRYTQNSV